MAQIAPFAASSCMRSIKLTIAMLLAASFGCVATAAAASPTYACVFEAHTTGMSPIMQLMGGSGSFTLTGRAMCPNRDTYWWKFTGSGTYTNSVCGSGTMDGVFTIDTYGTLALHMEWYGWAGPVSRAGEPGGAVTVVPNHPWLPSACADQLTLTGSTTF